jgi:hypothetical protein
VADKNGATPSTSPVPLGVGLKFTSPNASPKLKLGIVSILEVGAGAGARSDVCSALNAWKELVPLAVTDGIVGGMLKLSS